MWTSTSNSWTSKMHCELECKEVYCIGPQQLVSIPFLSIPNFTCFFSKNFFPTCNTSAGLRDEAVTLKVGVLCHSPMPQILVHYDNNISYYSLLFSNGSRTKVRIKRNNSHALLNYTRVRARVCVCVLYVRTRKSRPCEQNSSRP